MQNLFRLYRPGISTWRIYDTRQAGAPQLIAHGDERGMETVLNEAIWAQMQSADRG